MGRPIDAIEPPEVTRRILREATREFLGDFATIEEGQSIVTEGGLEVMIEGRALTNEELDRLIDIID